MRNAALADSPVRSRALRRRSLSVACFNAGLWGVGSGLASTTLIVFLVRRIGGSGQAVSWILAAPAMAGLVRLATPWWLERVPSRRRFAIGMFLSSATSLATLPVLSAPGVLPAGPWGPRGVGAAWTAYQVLEAIGVVALWAWLGDLVPPRVRGRFIGRREAWLNVGVVAGGTLAIAATVLWPRDATDELRRVREWQAYAACAVAGAVFLAAAALVLGQMGDPHQRPAPSVTGRRFRLGDALEPLADRRFRRLLTFGLWFSIANGIVQTAQFLFFINPLNLSFAAKKSLDGASRAMKAGILPGLGAVTDSSGNVPVLAASQATIAISMGFLLFATPAAPWWVLGAYVCWLAYAGHDVALPNLMLGHSPPGAAANYAAAWFAWTQLAFALSVLAGGALFDALSAQLRPLAIAGCTIDHFVVVFAAGLVLKLVGVPLALRIHEPNVLGHKEPLNKGV